MNKDLLDNFIDVLFQQESNLSLLSDRIYYLIVLITIMIIESYILFLVLYSRHKTTTELIKDLSNNIHDLDNEIYHNNTMINKVREQTKSLLDLELEKDVEESQLKENNNDISN